MMLPGRLGKEYDVGVLPECRSSSEQQPLACSIEPAEFARALWLLFQPVVQLVQVVRASTQRNMKFWCVVCLFGQLANSWAFIACWERLAQKLPVGGSFCASLGGWGTKQDGERKF